MNDLMKRDPGSFRDPGAYVFQDKNRVIRALTAEVEERFGKVYDSGVLQRLADMGLLIDCTRLNSATKELASLRGARGEQFAAFYQHSRVPFVSYPYEWCFSQLKAAALTHLNLQIAAFDQGYVLSDATAYNIQFINSVPCHIDVASVVPYEAGQFWAGYNQFCRQFLLPLLLEAWSGVRFQTMYRGAIDGIDFRDALAILPRSKLFTSPAAFMHVYLHGQSLSGKSSTSDGTDRKARHLKASHYRALLLQLQGFVENLASKTRPKSYWTGYASENSYTETMRQTKLQFIRDWAAREMPEKVLDIGGNTGDFSRAAIEGGASQSVILDSDLDSVERAFAHARSEKSGILPLVVNLLDPTPDMGWRQEERKGITLRAKADGLIALAVLHHLVIGGNLPLEEAVDWLVAAAPTGVIEFVPKTDPMVQGLLSMRADIYYDYEEESFIRAINAKAAIVDRHVFEENGRHLIAYSQK